MGLYQASTVLHRGAVIRVSTVGSAGQCGTVSGLSYTTARAADHILWAVSIGDTNNMAPGSLCIADPSF